MRIIWSESENRFEIEIPSGDTWQGDKDLLKTCKFKNTGPEKWTWYTTKTATLDKLRKLNPKSGLSITELALQKYKFLELQSTEKERIKKEFKEAAQPKQEEYFDDALQIKCWLIKPSETKFVSKYVRPEPPEAQCMMCGDSLYFYEYPDMCIWCAK